MAGYSGGLGVKNGNGKRERVDQEDDQEFMPLSKRINNIHLSPERLVNGAGSFMHSNGTSMPPHHSSMSNGYHGIPQRHIDNGYHHQHPSHQSAEFRRGIHPHSSSSSSSSQEHLNRPLDLDPSTSKVPVHPANPSLSDTCPNFQYRPALNQSANPHYYEANRTLFELYIERQLRTHQAPHPQVYGNSSTNGAA